MVISILSVTPALNLVGLFFGPKTLVLRKYNRVKQLGQLNTRYAAGPMS